MLHLRPNGTKCLFAKQAVVGDGEAVGLVADALKNVESVTGYGIRIIFQIVSARNNDFLKPFGKTDNGKVGITGIFYFQPGLAPVNQ